MIVYPKCYSSFMELISSNKTLLNKYIFKRVFKVQSFDVSLRDGLQSLSTIEREHFTTNIKKELYKNIIINHNPSSVEIGSIVNYKLLPIFSDTPELSTFFENNFLYRKKPRNYVLVPNLEKLKKGLDIGITHMSFITSVSNSFQLKNTRMTLDENYINLENMFNHLSTIDRSQFSVKIYVSCINECPIDGKIDNSKIINTINKFIFLKPDKICLSDTCGTLTLSEFKSLLNELKKSDINYSLLSLHLHINPDNENEAEQIVHYAIDNGIFEFDVSAINSGGCSITIDREKVSPNMSYEQYYKFLSTYLLNK
jgi:hydroxymethylglutaryl-CoA lyase